MNILLNFGEVQSRIEFLSAIIYFVISLYLIFLLFLKRSVPEKEKKLLLALSYGFLAISVIFVTRQIVQLSILEFGFYQSGLSTVLFMMLLILPAQYYCSERVESFEYSLKHYIFNLLFLVTANIIVQLISIKYIKTHGEISNTYLFLSLSLFFIYSGFLIYKFYLKIRILSKDDWSSIITHKNDIFIFASLTMFSIMLILFTLFAARYSYIRIVLSIFSIINTLLFLKITLPYNAKNLLTNATMNEDLTHLQEERHKINRQLSDNIKADELYGRLLRYFDKEKPYLKADLKIKQIALYLYSNKTYLSRIINDKNNQNFNQFVNYYRIEEVKKIFSDNNRLNIQELCLLSGFGSMATFSIAFRFHLGYTPADWCKEQKMRVHNG